MIVKIRTGTWDAEKETWDEDKTVLVTAGCGCCEEDIPATKENTEKAIKELEDFIEILKALL